VLGLSHLGGFASMAAGVDAALAQTPVDAAAWWSFSGGDWLAVIAMIFSAVIHTPAASVYVNFATAARSERAVLPAFVLGGLIAMPMPMLAGWIGIESLAKYGATAQLTSYQTVTRLATEINPWLGGIALAAVLAAVISSGGPILLSSAAMFVRDWFRGSASWPGERKLRAYRAVTVVYGLAAALVAWLGPIGSILDLLLFGFAMVVPPAIAAGYVLYWKRTTEAGAFWGIVLGYALGLAWYVLVPSDLDRTSPRWCRWSSCRRCRSSRRTARPAATHSTRAPRVRRRRPAVRWPGRSRSRPAPRWRSARRTRRSALRH
jgi:Na+/proline symporter